MVMEPMETTGVVPNPIEKPKKTIKVAQAGAKKKRAKSLNDILDHIAIKTLITNKRKESHNWAMTTFIPTAVARRASLSLGSHPCRP
jgi:hypothetical protein